MFSSCFDPALKKKNRSTFVFTSYPALHFIRHAALILCLRHLELCFLSSAKNCSVFPSFAEPGQQQHTCSTPLSQELVLGIYLSSKTPCLGYFYLSSKTACLGYSLQSHTALNSARAKNSLIISTNSTIKSAFHVDGNHSFKLKGNDSSLSAFKINHIFQFRERCSTLLCRARTQFHNQRLHACAYA